MRKYIILLAVGLIVLLNSCGGKKQAGVEAGNTKVAGVVLDSQGKPITAAIIRIYVRTGDSLVLVASDTTDALGQYSVDPKQEGEIILQVVVEQTVWTEQIVHAEIGEQTINIELPPEPIGEMEGNSGVITDKRDGQQYPWVRIGTQIWLAKNLNYSGDDGNGNRSYSMGWCYGSDVSDTSSHQDLATCDEYGRLYSWKTVMVLPDSCDTLFCSNQYEDPHQGICPEGWRIPDTLAFMILDSFVREEQGDTLGVGFSEPFLKEASSDTNWNRPPFVSSDPYGFSMKPGGDRMPLNAPALSDGGMGSYAKVWTTSEYPQPGGAYTWEFNSTVMIRSSAAKLGWASSIRCLR